MQPKVSVITVCYNSENSIEQTMQSVLCQTYTNIEYVIIDGASKDKTLSVIKDVAEKNTKSNIIVISEPDKGIYDAMQKGARLATGEWLIFRNCGDYFASENVIEKVFSRYVDKGEDFILCDTRYFKNHHYKDFKPRILMRHYFECMPVLHPSTFIRRTTQLKYPFRLEYKSSADYCFFVEAMLNDAKWTYIDEIVALFDSRSGLSTDYYEKSLKENEAILRFFSAPDKYVNKIHNRAIAEIQKKKIKKLFPFVKLFHYMNLSRQGWVKCNLNKILNQ